MSFPVTPVAYSPSGFIPRISFPPRKRGIYLIHNETSSHPFPLQAPHPHSNIQKHPTKEKNQKTQRSSTRATELVSGAGAKAERRKRARAVYFALHFCTSSPEPRAAHVLPYPLVRRPSPATEALGEGCGSPNTASGRAAGSRRGRLEPPPLLPQAAAGVGRRS